MKDDNSKLWVEMMICHAFRCMSDRKYPPERNKNVQLVETRTVHFARLLF